MLALTLDSVRRQKVLPDEVVVADDGSGPDTERLIAERAKDFPVPLIHSWQSDEGFRISRSRNLAVSRSGGEYCIFIDGDIILHPKFVESHLHFAKKNRLLYGGRVLLNSVKTKAIIEDQRIPSAEDLIHGGTNRHYAVHSYLLARLTMKVTPPGDKVRGCNMSTFKEDLMKVNGFNEDFVHWGLEDDEFAYRFSKAGGELMRIRFAAVQYHLDHDQHNKAARTPENTERNRRLLRETIESPGFWANNGIDKHFVIESHEPNTQDK